MLMEVKKHLRLMFVAFKYNLSKEMTNQISFIMQIVFMILNNSTFVVQWLILFSIKDNIGGYSFELVLILWSLAATVFGLSHVFFQNIYYLSDLIINGKIDVYLTQPKNVLFNIAISKTNPSAIGDVIFGYLVVIFVKPDFYTLAMFTIFSITGCIILTTFAAIMSSLTFWIKKVDLLISQLLEISILASTYPEGIFKQVTKIFLYTIVPVGFSAFIPIKIINSFNVISFLIIIFITIFITFLAFYIFNKGLKRYSSSNLMISRN